VVPLLSLSQTLLQKKRAVISKNNSALLHFRKKAAVYWQ
jgi:hypothetical protein